MNTYRSRHPEYVRAYSAKCRVRNRGFIEAAKKDRPCGECGVVYPSPAMDFHHRKGTTKRFTLGAAKAQCWSLKAIAEEMAKCDLLCANCHRLMHYVAA